MNNSLCHGMLRNIFQGLALLAVDLSGSGLSDGENISLGINETDDVFAVVNHLQNEGKTSRVSFFLHILFQSNLFFTRRVKCNLCFLFFLRSYFGEEVWGLQPL